MSASTKDKIKIDTRSYIEEANDNIRFLFSPSDNSNMQYLSHPASLLFYIDKETNKMKSVAVTINQEYYNDMALLNDLKQDKQNNYYVYKNTTKFYAIKISKNKCHVCDS